MFRSGAQILAQNRLLLRVFCRAFGALLERGHAVVELILNAAVRQKGIILAVEGRDAGVDVVVVALLLQALPDAIVVHALVEIHNISLKLRLHFNPKLEILLALFAILRLLIRGVLLESQLLLVLKVLWSGLPALALSQLQLLLPCIECLADFIEIQLDLPRVLHFQLGQIVFAAVSSRVVLKRHNTRIALARFGTRLLCCLVLLLRGNLVIKDVERVLVERGRDHVRTLLGQAFLATILEEATLRLQILVQELIV